MFTKFKNNNKKLQNYAHSIIPGLSGLFGKRPEMYLPGGNWPTYYSRAKGITIWDLKGKKYLDFSMVGVGCCVLGYADKDIDNVAKKIINRGTLTSLNPPEEIELAETLLEIHPWAEQVKFARTGGEMLTVAMRLARAATGKEKILFCGYHGWHDWYLSANLNKHDVLDNYLLPGLGHLGVPQGLKGTMIPFGFNNIEDIQKVIEPNDELYILGSAVENDKESKINDSGPIKIGKSKNHPYYYISDSTEKELLDKFGWNVPLSIFGGAILSICTLYIGIIIALERHYF